MHQRDSQNLLFAMLSTDPEVIKTVGKFANLHFLSESPYTSKIYVHILSIYMFQYH